uniref:LisH domain-containing protein n=1 Tax=Caenorhabditis tropicalis TaxID=1561998 RepID=A0A1I7UN69_9PELO
MQPDQGGRSDGGGRQAQQSCIQQTRWTTNRQSNAHMTERIDSLIFGYLRRREYHNTANALERESQHIPEPITHTDDQNRSFVTMTVNDRLHDLQLEEIITNFCLYGSSSGMHQGLAQVGEDLQRLTNRVQTMVSNTTSRSVIHQQLYARTAYSRQHQQHQIFTTRPAQQALAQMEIERINRIGELRYREEQQQQEELQQRVQSSSSYPNLDTESAQQSSQNHVEIEPVACEQRIDPEEREFSEDRDDRGSSRRKGQPHNRNEFLQQNLNALTNMCNHRGNDESDQGPLLNMDNIRPEFFSNLFFDEVQDPYQTHDYLQEQEDYLSILQDVRSTEHQMEESRAIQGSGAQDLEDGEINEGSNQELPRSFAPEPLLSPLGRDLPFRQESSPLGDREHTGNVTGQYLSQHITVPTRQEAPSTSNDMPHKEERERREGTGGSRRSISPQRVRSADDRKKHRDREKGFEKSTTQDREKRKDSNTGSYYSSTSHLSRQPSESHHNSHVQSDRESTCSSSSRATGSDRKEEKERKKKERSERDVERSKFDKEKRRKEKEQAIADMEKERRVKERERMNSVSESSSSSKRQQQASDLLNQARQHAAGSSKYVDANSLGRSDSFTAKKRKVGEETSVGTSQDRDQTPFKIPKKSSSSFPFPKAASSNEPSTSSKYDKSRSKTSYKKLSEGDDRPDTTHFIEIDKQRHPARLTSILLTCDTSYKEFHDGIQQKSAITGKPAKVSSYCSAEESSGPITPQDVPVCANPKGKMFAPMKGPSMIKKSDPSTSSSSSNGKESSSEGSSDIDEGRSSGKSRSHSPEVKMSVDLKKAHKVLEKIHGRR